MAAQRGPGRLVPALAGGVSGFGAGGPPGRREISSVQAPAEVAEVLERCAVARDLSGGWFNPWAVPGGLDPSGYVKGWAAQHALAAFSTGGICGVLVNAAGDIASTGGPADGTPFRIGIASPPGTPPPSARIRP